MNLHTMRLIADLPNRTEPRVSRPAVRRPGPSFTTLAMRVLPAVLVVLAGGQFLL